MEKYFENLQKGKQAAVKDVGGKKQTIRDPIIKSPSDTTVYRPAVRKANLVKHTDGRDDTNSKRDSIDQFIKDIRSKVYIAENTVVTEEGW